MNSEYDVPAHLRDNYLKLSSGDIKQEGDGWFCDGKFFKTKEVGMVILGGDAAIFYRPISNKQKGPMKNIIVVGIGTNVLYEIVRKLLTDAGVTGVRLEQGWRIELHKGLEFRVASGCVASYADPGFYEGPRGSDFKDCEIVNASTNMARLIELATAPKEIKVVDIAKENGITNRDGVISADGLTLAVGCHTASFQQIERVYLAMKEAQKK